MNSEPIQTSYFIPPDVTPGGEPAPWGGLNGFAANVIVSVNMTFNVSPGAQTLKVTVGIWLSVKIPFNSTTFTALHD